LDDHCPEYHNVECRDVRSDGAILAATPQDRVERGVDFGSERQSGLVDWNRSAMQREDKFWPVPDCVVEESADALDGRAIGVSGMLGSIEDLPEGPMGECGEQCLA